MPTLIQWTDETWNPTTGCNKVSPGCKNCYAEKMHKRLMAMFPQKYNKPFLDGVKMHESEMLKPFNWKKPKRIFVNSMSDLFHEDVTFEFIKQVFGVMELCTHHTFQILTKRPERMLHYLRTRQRGWRNNNVLPNVIVGTSAENQGAFNSRSEAMFLIKDLGWKTMLSCEPLLSPIPYLLLKPGDIMHGVFDWIIAGGESGPKARSINPEAFRNIRDQCKEAYVPFFFKQWGAQQPGNELDGVQHLEFPKL